MNLLGYLVLGILLPWCCGWALASLMLPRRDSIACAIRNLALGYFIGAVLSASFVQLMWHFEATGGPPYVAVVLAIPCLWRLRKGGLRIHVKDYRLTGWQGWLLLALLLVSGLRLYWLAMEVLQRPTFAWDAWGTWAYKAKALALSDGQALFLPINEWVKTGVRGEYPLAAYHYPTLIAAHQYWLYAWLGSWHDGLMHLPWVFALANLALLAAAAVKSPAGPAWPSMALAYAILSVPLLNTHAALAGYMDLWVALGIVAVVTWGLNRGTTWRPATLIVFLALAASLAAIKVEGLIWGATLVSLFAWSRLSTRMKGLSALVLSGVTILCLSLGVELGPNHAPWLSLSWSAVKAPYLGDIVFDFAFPWQAVTATLLLSKNWHLLIPVLGILLLRGAVVCPPSPQKTWLLSYTIASAASLGFLFFATDAAAWAESLTSFNRLFLHWAPAWAFAAFWLNCPCRRATYAWPHLRTTVNDVSNAARS